MVSVSGLGPKILRTHLPSIEGMPKTTSSERLDLAEASRVAGFIFKDQSGHGHQTDRPNIDMHFNNRVRE